MNIMKALFTLTAIFFLVSLSSALACHRWIFFDQKNHIIAGHTGSNYKVSDSKPKSGFGITVQPTTTTAHSVVTSTYGTSDSVATTTDCNWRTSNIEKFFHESYLQIAEESSQGQGPHLEALASQVGCNPQQTVPLEKAMQQNYHGVFGKEDINHSINEFYTVVNSDDQLAACWPKS